MRAPGSETTEGQSGENPQPRVWNLFGHRAGDNAQVRTLTECLAWHSASKKLEWRKPLPRWTPFYGRQATLRHLTKNSQETFEPPWPDVVISVGWRSVPVARWIKKQSGAKLVHIGRPRAPLNRFDLILTTPQYRLPKAENVVHLDGPVTAVSPDKIEKEAQKWRERLAHLPRPWTAVLIGGAAPPFHMPVSSAQDLGLKCDDLVGRLAGSLLIASGPRTPSGTVDAVVERLSAPHFSYEWSSDVENPYLAFLALSDRFVVTADSISMAQEAASTGRPVYLYPLPKQAGLYAYALLILEPLTREDKNWLGSLINTLVRHGLIVLPRFNVDFQDRLLNDGSAVILGDGDPSPAPKKEQGNTETAVRAVRSLFP